jgi:glutathione S-transferase
MDELYQAEWCPYSGRVRQRLTELGVPFIARQVPAESADRDELRDRTGSDEIPALVREDGTVISGNTERIIADLNHRYGSRARTRPHRERAAEHSG